jgi:hypothetical protein
VYFKSSLSSLKGHFLKKAFGTNIKDSKAKIVFNITLTSNPMSVVPETVDSPSPSNLREYELKIKNHVNSETKDPGGIRKKHDKKSCAIVYLSYPIDVVCM